MSFFEKLHKACVEKQSQLCIGLDPNKSDFNTVEDAEQFCYIMIDNTLTHACCFKPNIAFFEAYGPQGIGMLKRIITYIHDLNSLVILDCKRGDICSTAKAYATLCFDYLNADCVTLSPFLGYDSIGPFISGKYIGKGVFILCSTSNISALDIQDEAIVNKIASLTRNDGIWGTQTHNASLPLGLVIGATKNEICRTVRTVNTDSWFLCPGVGAQGGSVMELFDSLSDHTDLLHKVIVPISRGISNSNDYGLTAKYYKDLINKATIETKTLQRI
tara:strand:+ start:2213 stop:3034 length:822 start_codon:yes stop_codon:yes gene_type:complete